MDERNSLPSTSLNLSLEKGTGTTDDGLNINEFTFPRCEYKARFNGTTAFAMSEPEFWGTYFRSTSRGGNCDRISKKFGIDKTYTNKNTNKPSKKRSDSMTPARAGTIKSPWMLEGYNEIFITGSSSPKIDKNNDALLYDELLEYKMRICGYTAWKFKLFTQDPFEEKKTIEVYIENVYPCVMVQIKEHLVESIVKERASLYKIIIAYFVGITNNVAYNNNIAIELVNRASFGHNIPSVSVTGTSFRINIGIVPETYAEILAESLKSLNDDFLLPLLNKAQQFQLRSMDLCSNHNIHIDGYNKRKWNTKKTKVPRSVEKWNENDHLLDVLRKVGDSSGRAVSYQITRKRQYIDLLANYVHKEMKKEERNFIQPLKDILDKLDYKNKRVTITLCSTSDHYNTEMTSFSNEVNTYIKDDHAFWGIIKNISSVFGKQNSILRTSIKERQLFGLYKKLEKANSEFIANTDYQNSTDGYGSDSDCDVSIKTETEYKTFYSRKITVSTGMRAINLAHFLSLYLTRTANADTKYMYFETSRAIEDLVDIIKELKLERNGSKQKEIKYIDLTHCAASGSGSEVPELSNLNEEEVIVFDYTSATSQRITEAIKLIKDVPVLLLVSSGLKNEQIGADTNPYGTVRIITQKEKVMNELYFGLKACLTGIEELPSRLHDIRKAYKDAGAVVPSAHIYGDGEFSYVSKSKTLENYNITNFDFPSQFKKIFELFYCGICDEELNNLTKNQHQDINQIVQWSFDKIKCLGSSRVELVKNKEDFRHISDLYDTNSEFTEYVVRKIKDKNIPIRDYTHFEAICEICKNEIADQAEGSRIEDINDGFESSGSSTPDEFTHVVSKSAKIISEMKSFCERMLSLEAKSDDSSPQSSTYARFLQMLECDNDNEDIETQIRKIKLMLLVNELCKNCRSSS